MCGYSYRYIKEVYGTYNFSFIISKKAGNIEYAWNSVQSNNAEY